MKATVLALAMKFALAGGCLASEISHHTFPSKTLERDYAYNLYLPDGYESGKLDYPVLYLLHGSFENENRWPVRGRIQGTLDRLISEGKIPPAVVVMPGSLSWWVDGYNEPAKTAFFEDLIPHIETTWNVISERDGRVVGGLSAGGSGAINFVLEHPETFAACAALSPAVYVPLPPETSSANRHPAYLNRDGRFDPEKWKTLNYTSFIDGYKAQDLVVPIYINSGDHDKYDIAYHGAVLFQSLWEHQPKYVEFRVVDADHEWELWAETIPEALEYVFRYTSRPQGRKPTN
ncbi:esterase [Roseibium algicola]|uniref:Esterase n=1 Tax=Roseibium algicola TaxID=2857014 RepID=A0ABN4WUH0_9HYPH|nr:alpha/beta hydrolase-fold protein [Roseibium aggregatum]AQQ05339.1 esterase [Roseibium aggregatum]